MADFYNLGIFIYFFIFKNTDWFNAIDCNLFYRPQGVSPTICEECWVLEVPAPTSLVRVVGSLLLPNRGLRRGFGCSAFCMFSFENIL